MPLLTSHQRLQQRRLDEGGNNAGNATHHCRCWPNIVTGLVVFMTLAQCCFDVGLLAGEVDNRVIVIKYSYLWLKNMIPKIISVSMLTMDGATRKTHFAMENTMSHD